MNIDKLSYYIDLDKYPLHDPSNARYQSVVEEARQKLREDGCYVLKNIVNREALLQMQKEAQNLESQAHYTQNKVNVYFSEEDLSFPEDHPRRFFMERSNGFVSGDKFTPDSKIKELYYMEELKNFIAACLDYDEIYHYADPLASLTINVNKPGDRFSWHFDTNEFTVTMLLQDADEGGVFQYIPNIRNKNDECYDEVLKVLKGDRTRVKEVKINEGDLQLFKGRYSLHRASRVGGTRTRNLVVYTFTENKDVLGSAFRSEELYGKSLSEQKKSRVRSDALTD